MEKRKNNNVIICAVISLLLLGGIVGVVNIGKAQQAQSDLAELTEFANSVSGNIEAFNAGLDYLASKVGMPTFGAREVLYDLEMYPNKDSMIFRRIIRVCKMVLKEQEGN